jgi:hypothetical protein
MCGGHFEYVVMSFWPSMNIPSVSQYSMNDVFKSTWMVFVVWCVGDIFISLKKIKNSKIVQLYSKFIHKICIPSPNHLSEYIFMDFHKVEIIVDLFQCYIFWGSIYFFWFVDIYQCFIMHCSNSLTTLIHSIQNDQQCKFIYLCIVRMWIFLHITVFCLKQMKGVLCKT